MKKIFTEAEVEVKAFELEDVITVSGGNGETEEPIDPDQGEII